ncbi:acetylcholine receptor protein alpha 1, 2, 3, 4 invertebrate [Anopheles darlingi]|uniref:Acetylcholine receptor protein alpha 1, 2, 3, 4 invertebrate n=1 Tax=Anopheles darlingi TaxID=43151 RepID=W5J1V5_ANODA|nr:acetylcholine receptor protein alpha 1, 2, 3, 4 invertebrate [Anopheles darlingi]
MAPTVASGAPRDLWNDSVLDVLYEMEAASETQQVISNTYRGPVQGQSQNCHQHHHCFEWNDYKLKWNPDDYGGVDTLHVPSEHIWLPDITCFMKFGSWTYDGYMVDLRHLQQTPDSDNIDIGIDLQDYYISVEWDIMKVPAVRNEKFYSCCEEPYPDIIFNITLRRKTLFYTVNLIIPCVGISFLSVLVFYLPSDSGEKISLCISILLSLTVFFLLLAEIIPPTSLTVPLLGKYLLFTMMLVTLSVVVTIAVLNVNFRSPVTHKMAPWVHRVFIELLPKVLCIERPKKDDDPSETEDQTPTDVLTDVFQVPPDVEKYVGFCGKEYGTDFDIPALPPSRFDVAASGGVGPCFGEPPLPALPLPGGDDDLFSPTGNGDMSPTCCGELSPTFEKPLLREMEKTIEASRFVAQHVRNKDKFESIEEDWKYVALVLDRLFLWIFTIACVLGTALIILQAPSLYDNTQPIDAMYSKIAKKKMELLKMGSENV